MKAGIILAGGSGKRLWPLSREKKPKQFLKLFLEKTFMESAVERLSLSTDKIFVSTSKELADGTKKILPDTKLIVEPERRDTAAAIGLCATKFEQNDVLVFIPADAFVREKEKFAETINSATKLAKENDSIVVVGIKPSKPETCYGYIEVADKNKVASFKEKPSIEKAKEYVRKGFLWNGGIFVVRAGVLLDLFKKHAPDIYEVLLEIKRTGKLEENYSKIRKISFDFAVMEKASNVLFVEAGFYWNDVGGFQAISEIVAEKNAVLQGKLIEENSKGNVVSSDSSEKIIALIDCEDLVIVDTKDALLVCPKKSTEKIKKLVTERVLERYK